MLAILCYKRKTITKVWEYRLFQLLITCVWKCSQPQRWHHIPEGNWSNCRYSSHRCLQGALCIRQWAQQGQGPLNSNQFWGVSQADSRFYLMTKVLSSVGIWPTCFLHNVETSWRIRLSCPFPVPNIFCAVEQQFKVTDSKSKFWLEPP